MDVITSNKVKAAKGRIKSILKTKQAVVVIVLFLVVAVTSTLALANQQTTATPKGIWLSIDEVKKLPTTGPAWTNVKAVADKPLGNGIIGAQTSTHDTQTYASALVYARTGDEVYRRKAANGVMSIVGTELKGPNGDQDNRTLSLGWHLTAYVVSADLINLPAFNAEQNTTFTNWLRDVRNKKLNDDKTLIETHEIRPNNWGTGAGASRVAADLYLNDQADLARAASVFKGWLGDRLAYSGFSYGDLSFQCDASKPVGVNPAGCKRGSISIDGALPDDMRRGGSYKDAPTPTHYPWTALEGAMPQAIMLSRNGYDTLGWSNQALKRSMQYLYDLSVRVSGEWWHGSQEAAKFVPWLTNYAYGTKFPTHNNGEWGRVMNFTDWTHATTKPQEPTADTEAPTPPSNLKSVNATAGNVQLSWSASTDNVAVTGYEVSRDSTVLGFTGSASYTDKTAAASQIYTYGVRAFDAAGNASAKINVAVATTGTTGDTVKPVSSITKPANNSTITAESTPISFTATDNVAVTKVELYVDTQLEATVTDVSGRTSFNANWNTKVAGNGKHTLQAKAYDAAGNVGSSSVVNVTIKLTTAPPPPPPSGPEIKVTASGDARVSQNNSSKNYGKEDFLRVRNYGNESWKTVLKFEVTGLTGAPKSAKLRLFANDGGPDAGTLFAISSNWSEGTISWKTTPVFTTANKIGKSTNTSVNDQSWAEFNVTGKITGNGTYAFGLWSDDDNSIYYSSREGKNKPVLILTR